MAQHNYTDHDAGQKNVQFIPLSHQTFLIKFSKVSQPFLASDVITKCCQSSTTFITLIGFHHLFSINNSLYANAFPINEKNIKIEVPTKFLENNSIDSLFHIEKDVKRANIKPSTLDHPEILNYYLNGWRYWN